MKKLIRSFISSMLGLLLLASCSFGSSDTQATVAAQATSALPAVVTLELTVQADTSVTYNTVGQVIKLTQNVRNSGSVSAPGPMIVTGATCPDMTTIGNLDANFDANETITCNASYTITQADLDKGSVTITTMATVNNVNSNQVTTSVPTVPPVVLKLTKTAAPTTYSQTGQTITYSYVITNVGAATLGPAQFTVTDAAFAAPFNCGEATATLASNATVTCTATYTITQADMGVASISTNATATGGGAPVSQAVGATVTKSDAAQPSGGQRTHTVVEGEWLWQIARCYGVDPNKLAADNKDKIPDPSKIKPGVILTVNNPGGYSKFYGPPCITFVSHTLQAGDTWATLGQKYSADATVLQLANPDTSLSAAGTIIKLRIPNYTMGTVTTPPATQSKTLSVTVAANPTAYNQTGQVITFTYTVKNSGTESLGPAQFTVSGGLLGSTPLNCGAASSALAAGATLTCTSTYTVTQEDMTVNSISHQVTASGGGAGPSQAASVTVNKSTAALLTLTIAANPLTYSQAGQIITFTYAIKNSGSTNLGPAQFTITGGLHGATPVNCGDAAATILPGGTLTCTASYTITEADLAVPTLSHLVIAAGGGAAPSQPASITLTKQ